VLLEDVALTIAAAEFDWLACQAATSSTVVLPLDGADFYGRQMQLQTAHV
jgi:hypothetical protein